MCSLLRFGIPDQPFFFFHSWVNDLARVKSDKRTLGILQLSTLSTTVANHPSVLQKKWSVYYQRTKKIGQRHKNSIFFRAILECGFFFFYPSVPHSSFLDLCCACVVISNQTNSLFFPRLCSYIRKKTGRKSRGQLSYIAGLSIQEKRERTRRKCTLIWLLISPFVTFIPSSLPFLCEPSYLYAPALYQLLITFIPASYPNPTP